MFGCRHVEEGERATVTALLMSVLSTVSRLARSVVGNGNEDGAEQLAGEYIR